MFYNFLMTRGVSISRGVKPGFIALNCQLRYINSSRLFLIPHDFFHRITFWGVLLEKHYIILLTVLVNSLKSSNFSTSEKSPINQG